MRFLQIKSYGEEIQEYSLELDDGTIVYISYTDHDMHGWSGMEAVRDVIESIAKALKIEIVPTVI